MSAFGAIVWLVVVSAVVMIIPWGPSRDYMKALPSGNPEKAFYLWMMFWILKFCHEMVRLFVSGLAANVTRWASFLVFIRRPTSTRPARGRSQPLAASSSARAGWSSSCSSPPAFIWLRTSPNVPFFGLPINELACDAIMIAGFTTVIFNANPLLRYDGYYMLSDFLEIPNLQMRSREYLMGLIKRHVWRLKLQQPLPPPGQRVLLFVYGILSGITASWSASRSSCWSRTACRSSAC
jgi:putative peptide zinc metalloprotease protein